MVNANPLSIFCRAKLKPSNFRCMDISHHIHNPSIFCAEQGEWAKTSKVGLERVMTLNCISTLPVLIRFLSVMLCEVEEVVCSRVFINTSPGKCGAEYFPRMKIHRQATCFTEVENSVSTRDVQYPYSYGNMRFMWTMRICGCR